MAFSKCLKVIEYSSGKFVECLSSQGAIDCGFNILYCCIHPMNTPFLVNGKGYFVAL